MKNILSRYLLQMMKILIFGKKGCQGCVKSVLCVKYYQMSSKNHALFWGGIMLANIKGAIHVKMNLCGFKDGLLILPPTLIFHFGGTPETEGTSLYVWIRQSVSQSVS